jgi:hypothetical protein
MKRNEASWDRITRVVLGVALIIGPLVGVKTSLRPLNPPTVRCPRWAKARRPLKSLLSHHMAFTVALLHSVR